MGNGMVFLLPFPKGTCPRPSPPSRWAGRYEPFAVRAAGRVSCKRYSLPLHNPTREGGPGGGTSSPGGSFPHFSKEMGPRPGRPRFPAVPTAPGPNPQRPHLKKCAFVPGQAGTRTHCQLLNCTKLSDRHRLERGVDDLSPIQIPSLQTVNENLRRGSVGGERNVVLVAHLVDILQVGVQVAGLGV